MIVIEENDGRKAEWSLAGSVVTVGGFDVDLADAETDVEARVLLYQGSDGEITDAAGARYAALIVIPPRTYIESELPPDGEGEEGGIGLVPVAVDPDACRLHLWAIITLSSEESE